METKTRKDKIVKIPLEVNVTKIAKDIYPGFPECSFCLPCTGWDYDNFKFSFYEEEEDKTHIVTLDIAEKGVAKLIEEWAKGNCHFFGIKTFADLLDTCNWDAIVCDASVQYGLFGELVYG